MTFQDLSQFWNSKILEMVGGPQVMPREEEQTELKVCLTQATLELPLWSLDYGNEEERLVFAYVATGGWDFITDGSIQFRIGKEPRFGSKGHRYKGWRPGFESWLSVWPWAGVQPFLAGPLFSHGPNGDEEIVFASVIRLLRGSGKKQESACKSRSSTGLILLFNPLRTTHSHTALI